MNWTSWLLWGFVATVVLTTLMAACQGLGLTRMSIPFMLGTMFTGRSNRAKLVGFLVHLTNGWLFALLYVAAFHAWHAAGWWRGGPLRVGAAAVLTVSTRARLSDAAW